MPRVPDYGDGTGPQLQTNALRLPQADARRLDGYGRLLSVAGQQLGDASDVVFEMERDRATAEAGELELRASEALLKFQQEAETTRRGTKAQGLQDDVNAFWAEFRDKELATKDGLTAEIARPGLERARLRSLQWAGQFERTETAIAAEQAFKAAKQTLLDTPTTDTAVLRDIADELRQRNAAWGESRGMDKATVEAITAKDLTVLHAGAIARLATSNNPEAASQYYAQHVHEISDPQGKIKHYVDQTVAVATAMSLGADLAARYGPTQTEAAIKELDRRTDLSIEQKRLAREELEHRHAVRQADIDRARSEAFGAAQLEYERTGTVSAATLATLAPEHQAAILRQRRVDAERAAGKVVEPDFELYSELLSDNEKLRQTDLNTLRGQLTAGQLNTLAKLKGGPDDAQAKGVFTATQRMNAVLNRRFPDKTSKRQLRQRGIAADEIMSRVDEYARTHGTLPDEKTFDSIVLDVLTQPAGGWTAGPILAEALTDPDKLEKFVNRIPKKVRKELEQALRQKGYTVDNEGLARAYRQYVEVYGPVAAGAAQ
jgi:hypothetical protein